MLRRKRDVTLKCMGFKSTLLKTRYRKVTMQVSSFETRGINQNEKGTAHAISFEEIVSQ